MLRIFSVDLAFVIYKNQLFTYEKVFFTYPYHSLFIFASCKKKIEEKPAPDTTKSVDDYIKAAPQPVQAVASDTIAVGQPVVDKSDKNYVCTIKKVSAGYAFNEQVVMNPQTDVIYPGALLDGNSVVSGAYTPILVDRAPMTISTNMDNLVGDKSIVIDKPSLSGVREGVSKLLQKGVDGNTASLMSFESYDVSSETNLNIALGVSSKTSAKIAGGLADVSVKIKGSLGYGSTTKKK